MKFGKSLSNQIEETLPEWRDKFLSYKDLKKRLKGISVPTPTAGSKASFPTPPPNKRPRLATGPEAADDPNKQNSLSSSSSSYPSSSSSSSSGLTLTKEEADFISLLEAELDKFNTFFVEKEEEYVIRQKELQDRITAVTSNDSEEELMKIRKEIVDFHGEMVLLENYSAFNYTGLVKILKKYDKRTGALLRLPFIRNVLQQPFFTTDLLYKLVKECETMLDRLFPAHETSAAAPPAPEDHHQLLDQNQTGRSFNDFKIPELEEIEYMESMYMKSTVSALRVLRDVRKGSSTVSVFSLPPLQLENNGGGSVDGLLLLDDRWALHTPHTVLEQAAK